MVESQPSKLLVAGSNPVSRSRIAGNRGRVSGVSLVLVERADAASASEMKLRSDG